jgi:hypothetical protein
MLFETLLIPFVGIALASISKNLINRGPEATHSAVLIFVMVIGVIMNQAIRNHDTQQLLPDPLRFPHEQLLALSGTKLGSGKMSGMGQTRETRFKIKANKAALILPEIPNQPRSGRPVVASVRIAVNSPAGEGCLPGVLSHLLTSAGRRALPRYTSSFAIHEGDSPQWYNFGVSWLERVRGHQLVLLFRCPIGTEIQITEFLLVESRVAEVYRDRYMRKRAGSASKM